MEQVSFAECFDDRSLPDHNVVRNDENQTPAK